MTKKQPKKHQTTHIYIYTSILGCLQVYLGRFKGVVDAVNIYIYIAAYTYIHKPRASSIGMQSTMEWETEVRCINVIPNSTKHEIGQYDWLGK